MNYFSSVSFSSSEDPQDLSDIVESATEVGFQFHEVKLNDLILAVAHFKSKATGSDEIPHSVIAKSLPTLGPFLVQFFNQSFKEGTFPSAWKKAVLIALKKVSIPASPSDFRPIALLCFLSKVLEKLAHDQLILFLNNNKILDPLQTGFRQYSSTETALLKLTDDIRIGISNRLITVLLQFDFSKAFDTVSPSKLLKKLSRMGFSKSALRWLKSYLENRKLQVLFKSSYSQECDINLGVPQGSVLGPLLFCLYINDVKDHLSDGVFRLLYADDLQVYVQVPPESIIEALATLSSIARSITNWANKVALRLNQNKTRAIYFASSAFVDKLDKLKLSGVDMGNGVIVPFVSEVKSLGVVLDSKLSWEPQVISIEKKVNRVLYTLRFIRHCTSENLRRRLVQALIIPHLDYCSVLLLDAKTSLKERIQRLSNSGIRYIFCIRKDTHVSPYRLKLGWLSMDSRRLYFCAIIIYKILRMNQPTYLTEFFTKYTPKETARGHSQTKELVLSHVVKGRGALSLQVFGVSFWNTIPSTIRFLPSLNRFKSALFKHLALNM